MAAITGTEFNVSYKNDKDVLIHRNPLLGKGWVLDGVFDYLKMDDFPEQDLDSIFTLNVVLNVFSATAGLIVLLDTRNEITNKGLLIALDIANSKIIVQFFVSTSVYGLTEYLSIPFKISKRHSITVCYDGSNPITGLTCYFDAVILKSNISDLTTFNTFGGVTTANNIPINSTIVNGLGIAHIGRNNVFGSPTNSKVFVLKKWELQQGIYTRQTSRKSFNTSISSLPNFLVDLDTDKVTGQPITDNENTVTISQFGGNTYTTFIS